MRGRGCSHYRSWRAGQANRDGKGKGAGKGEGGK